MPAKSRARKKQQKKAKRPAARPRPQKKPVKTVMQAVQVAPLQPVQIEEEQNKSGDEFFDEEGLKEFSVKDEEEDADESDISDGSSEPAWDEDEY
jgi:hypothetical protein